MPTIGRKEWAIPEGYIPEHSHGSEPEMTSHEAACLLNATDRVAHVSIMVYFSNREPAGPYYVNVRHEELLTSASMNSESQSRFRRGPSTLR